MSRQSRNKHGQLRPNTVALLKINKTDIALDKLRTEHTVLIAVAKDAYEALLAARGTLAHVDISTKGGRIDDAIETLGLTLYPPSGKAIDAAVDGANLAAVRG